MTKPRDILKGKVKRLLREQEDMGQICDPAVQHCVSALEAFVHDLGRRMMAHAETHGAAVLTPIELKQCVLGSEDFAFLHAKVRAIDESDAKYHKTGTRKRQRQPAVTATADGKAKKATAKASASALQAPASKRASSTRARGKKAARTQTEADVDAPASDGVRSAPGVPAVAVIEEDDNYDSSDSDSE